MKRGEPHSEQFAAQISVSPTSLLTLVSPLWSTLNPLSVRNPFDDPKYLCRAVTPCSVFIVGF